MRFVSRFLKIKSFEYHPELIYMMTRGIRSGVLLVNFLGFTIFSVVMRDYIPFKILFLWFIAQAVLMMLRIWLAKRLELYTRQNDTLKKRYLNYNIFASIVSAFLWGLTSWLTAVYAPMPFTFLPLAILLTLTAGATLTLGSVYHAYVAFTSTTLFMLIVSLIYLGETIDIAVALVTVLAMVILMGNGYLYFLKIKKMVELSEELKSFNAALEERVKKEVAKNMEKDIHLMHQERLAQVGEMVSMIAHQWRQPLHIIATAATDMDLKIQLDTIDYTSCRKNIDTISDLTQHLSSTIDDFRDFFRVTKEKEITSMEKIVTATLRIVKEYIESKNITVHTEYNSSETFVGYPNEIKQVLLNLLKNAEDILLERNVGNAQLWIKTFSDDAWFYLEVCDNAGGVPQEMMAHIFDAYVSTKPHEEGTGLGLYMCRMIIEDHCHGRLSLRNEEEGACFRIALPKAAI